MDTYICISTAFACCRVEIMLLASIDILTFKQQENYTYDFQTYPLVEIPSSAKQYAQFAA